MSELTEFLLARIAEDEAVARAVLDSHDPLDWSAAPPRLMAGGAVGMDGPVDGPSGYESLVIDPARVLRECEAKRRIVEDCKWMIEHPDLASDYELSGRWESCHLAMCALATVYADHPDFRDEWSVEP